MRVLGTMAAVAAANAQEQATIENTLVVQKDTLRRAIADANEWEDLHRVLMLFEFVSPLWNAAGYGYKVREVGEFINERAEFLIDAEEAFLRGERKNSRARASTELAIRELKDIRGRTPTYRRTTWGK